MIHEHTEKEFIDWFNNSGYYGNVLRRKLYTCWIASKEFYYEKANQTTKPQIITLDLIKELRNRGKSAKAEELLRIYRKDLIKVKKDELSTIKKQDRKIKQFFGVCTRECCKNPALGGLSTCEDCRGKGHKYLMTQ